MTLIEELMHLYNLDEDTLRAIVAIQAADLEKDARSTTANRNGRLATTHRQDQDAIEARNLVMKEIDDVRRYNNDANLARSIASAVLSDARAIEAARNDMRENNEDEGDDVEANGLQIEHPGTSLARWAGLYMGEQAGKEQYAVEYQRTQELNGTNISQEQSRRVADWWSAAKECVSCLDQKSHYEIIVPRCNHPYCQECLCELFQKSFMDESLFPPRCCHNNLEGAELAFLLSKDLLEKFEEKKVEFGTDDRTYCHIKTCSTFIRPRPAPQRRADCPKCGAETCFRCKQEYHRGACLENTEDQAVLELAEGLGWRRCSRCNTMVELVHGCHHMTCKCRYEFCYLCGGPWIPKTCNCPTWDERRLLERAQAIADRDGHINGNEQAGQVERAAAMLRERHECDHLEYESFGGQFECEECHDEMPLFIYQCRQCEIRVCRRCRFNRL